MRVLSCVLLVLLHRSWGTPLDLSDGLGFMPPDEGVAEQPVEIHNTADDQPDPPEGQELSEDPVTPDPEKAEVDALLDKLGLFEMEELELDEADEEDLVDDDDVDIEKRAAFDEWDERYVGGVSAAEIFGNIVNRTRANLAAARLQRKTLANQRAIIPMSVSDGSRRDLNMDITSGLIDGLHDLQIAAQPIPILYRSENRLTAAFTIPNIRSQTNFRLRVGRYRAVPGQNASGFVQALTANFDANLDFELCDDGTPRQLSSYTPRPGSTELTSTSGIPNNWAKIDRAGLLSALKQQVATAVNTDVRGQLEGAVSSLCTCC